MIKTDSGVNPYTPRTVWHTALLASGMGGAMFFNIVYFCFGLISPSYFVIHQPIGDLQLQPHGWIQTANFVLGGVFLFTFAAGLRMELASGFGATMIPLFHILTGISIIVFALIPQGPVRICSGVLGFLFMLISMILMAVRFASHPRWRRWDIYTIITMIVVVLLTAKFCYGLVNKAPYIGIWERLVVVSRLVWITAFTVRLLNGRRLSPYPAPVVENM
jgi:hypothetical protein